MSDELRDQHGAPDAEFYIGYDPDVPPGVAARVRVAVVAAVLAVLAAAGLSLGLHERLLPARFDFGHAQAVAGRLTRAPYPALATATGTVWLVGRGKHGADADVATLGDGAVTLQGTAIQRGDTRMVEVVPGSVTGTLARAASLEPHAPPAGGDDVTLVGEIVDSKCFLGVMNPGEGTVHRDCANLCLRGGIPPMLLVRHRQGREALVLLVGADGRAIGPELAPLAGAPVAVLGRLSHVGDQPVLAAEPGAYRRIDSR
ncbi:MAG: hypothetical protein AB7O28_08955 [Vicinamibacterales bacterium]